MTFFSLSAVAASTVLAYVAANWRSPEKDTLQFELRRQIIQFLVVITLGAIFSFVLDFFKSRAETRTIQIDLDRTTLTRFVKDLDRVYRAVKNIRQHLMSEFEGHDDISGPMWQLRRQMENLEQLKIQVSDYHLAKHGRPCPCRTVSRKARDRSTSQTICDAYCNLDQMDEYIGNIWKEYRGQLSSPTPGLGPDVDLLGRYRANT